MELKAIVQLLIQLESVTGEGSQKEKQRLIRENDCLELRYVLKLCFDPLIVTHINKVERIGEEDYEDRPEGGCKTFENFRELLEKLISLKAATDEIRKEVYIFIEMTDLLEEEKRMLAKIFTKNVNIGIGRAIINEALGFNLIPNNEMMKAEDNKEVVKKWLEEGKSVFAEEKFDGVRIWCEMVRGKIEHFYTYNFQELNMDCMQNIAKQLRMIFPLNNFHYFIDGEMLGKNRQSVSGLITKILKGTAPKEIDKNFVYHVFDYDKMQTVADGVGKLKYILRKKLLGNLFQVAKSWEQDWSQIKYVRKYPVKNWGDVEKIYGKVVAEGGEGLILKLGDHLYETKRSKSWIKMKEEKVCDLKVVSVFPGKSGTKREATIGGFVCESADKLLSVEVGSGFSDKQLTEIAKNPNYFIGKIISVKYNSKIEDKFGKKSLFLPRLVEIRFDKNTADNINKIK
jgi:DNA ligase-1